MADVIRVPNAKIALSTASVYPERTPDAFELAARLGYDGVEIMVGADPVSQDIDVIERLSEHYEVPVLAIHAPCLLVTQRVWGRDPWAKLVKAQKAAERLGASTVVVHPPFRWQRDYARDFGPGWPACVTRPASRSRSRTCSRSRPGATTWSPTPRLEPRRLRLPARHARPVAHRGVRLRRHGDGDQAGRPARAPAPGRRPRRDDKDEHLVPGRGNQPCAAMLRAPGGNGYGGLVVLEINTRKAVEPHRADRRPGRGPRLRPPLPGGSR